MFGRVWCTLLLKIQQSFFSLDIASLGVFKIMLVARTMTPFLLAMPVWGSGPQASLSLERTPLICYLFGDESKALPGHDFTRKHWGHFPLCCTSFLQKVHWLESTEWELHGLHEQEDKGLVRATRSFERCLCNLLGLDPSYKWFQGYLFGGKEGVTVTLSTH